MGIEIILLILVGILAGGVINVLADELPYRRNSGLPTYPDGTARPILAWLGITAFIFGLRTPKEQESNASDANKEKRKRNYEGSPKLGWRYPLTEILTAFLMVLTYLRMQDEANGSSAQMIVWLIYMAILVLITVIDMEHKLIMFVVMIPSAVLALIDGAIITDANPILQDALVGGAVGFIIFFIFYQGGFLFTYIMGRSRGQQINTVAFGFGDVMMITFSGLILGFQNVIFVMFISVFLGSFGALLYLVIKFVAGQRYQLFTAIPYGPYIVAATIIVLLFTDEVSLMLLGYAR